MSAERYVPVNGVELCVQTFGDAADAAILLIAGMSSPMDWWENGFCERLAAGRRYVVRYDLRDTGRSTSYPPGEPGYTGADLRDDVVALLDALSIDAAHLVGVSMGAAMAQCIAVEHPGRVRSLTLIDTTAALPGTPDGLPGIEPELAAYFEAAGQRPAPDWTDRAAVVDMLVEDQRAFMRRGFDEARVRAIAERIVDRSNDVGAMVNHGQLEPGREPDGSLADIVAPTLVIHGTADPLFPVAHGEALAAAIPDAGLLPLEGVGHEPPPPADWDLVVPALLRHTAGTSGRLRGVSLAYDTVAEDYAAYLPDTRAEAPLDLAMVDAFCDEARSGGGPVLDAGCGTGRMSRYLAQHGCLVEGVDLSPHMVAMARRDHPGLTFIVGSLTDLPFPDRRFSGVLLWYSIIHTPPEGQRRVFAEVRRVLGPAGVVLVGCQSGEGTRDVSAAYRRFGHEIRLERHLYTADHVAAHLEAVGMHEVCRLVRRATGEERDEQAFVLAKAG